VATKGGLRSITLEERHLADRKNGHVRVRLEPSNSIATGIFMEVNDEYHSSTPANPTGATEVVDILCQHWQTFMDRAHWIVDQIIHTIDEVSRG
jgi:hypothetical protein